MRGGSISDMKKVACIAAAVVLLAASGVCFASQTSGIKEVIPLTYDWARNFSEGLTAVRRGDNKTGRWGFIDKSR